MVTLDLDAEPGAGRRPDAGRGVAPPLAPAHDGGGGRGRGHDLLQHPQPAVLHGHLRHLRHPAPGRPRGPADRDGEEARLVALPTLDTKHNTL